MALLAIIMILPFSLSAQTIIMPVTGSGDTTMSYAEVFDNGGPSQPYSPQCNSTYTFHTVNSSGRYIINVESFLTHPAGNASLQIFNGTTTSGQSICNFPQNINGEYYSNGNTVTIRFVSDDDDPTAGYKVTLCEYDNDVAYNIQTGYLDSNTYFIKWEGGSQSTIWTLQYAVVDYAVDIYSFFDTATNFTTTQVDTNYFVVYNIPVGQHVVYCIFTPQGDAPCTRIALGQGAPFVIQEECPCIKPDSVFVENLEDSLHITWSYSGTVSNWHIWYPTLYIDTVVDGNVFEFTIPYNYPCFLDLLMINGGCDRSCNLEYVYLPVGGCHLSVGSIRRISTTGSSITLEWNMVQDSGALLLFYYRPHDNPYGTYILYDTLPGNCSGITVLGLSPVTSYDFLITVLCPDGQLSCINTQATYSTTLDNCIDFVNLYDHENIHLTWGIYSDPMRNTIGGNGRHVPIIDTSLRDANTGSALRCVPSGELASFRLGDDNIGAQAETVTFDYEVDSLDKDMLVLKYAVVLQNSSHNSQNQPHFTMEILDSQGQIVDTNCCYADFYAAGDLGWNSVSGSNVIWKDWTTVGIDIARYHGQRIKIRFTTKDCSDGGHFGYAYFSISCDSKRIALVNLCETLDSVRLRVPEGFEYSWTHGDDPTVISTENEIFVPADSSVYHCHASFVGKPDCSFDVHSYAVLPKPRADLKVKFDTCNNKAILLSTCHVDIDSTLLPYVRQTIDSVWWQIAGETIIGDTAVMQISGNGSYPVRLFCRLSESQCSDSMDAEVVIDFFHASTIVGDTLACNGDTLTLWGHVTPYNEVAVAWDNGLRDTLRTVVLSSDTLLTFYVNYLLCYDTLYHHISVKPLYSDTVVASFCMGECDTLGFQETQTGLYTHTARSVDGCDSMMTIDLTIFPTYYDTVRYVSCDEPYQDGEFAEDSTGFYTHTYRTAEGCDSIFSLDFVRKPVFIDTARDEIYFGEYYEDHGFYEGMTGFYEMTYNDIDGCDSIWRLDLYVVNLRFPNVVTPNGDGYNDCLAIVGLLDATMFDYNCLWVFDRWGRRIYKKENINKESDFWFPDKTHTPDGTYFYRFHASGSKKEVNYKGVVEVIR